ncbi:sensor histidine kinase [Fusibacter bizertensis]|uniref:histidine kinase n=1 Tax=Fusibacter bizertensis TaxID=1488331 RepID=A0ABT6N9E6_9FIRM|nr:sensor histidine kinase [Fusibacter bizertensis]MDH8677041.1 sensor histidine kinase [Fusibacter bizertensis]
MTINKQNIEKLLLVAVFTTFMGQIYMLPFGTNFRLTFAVVVLNILMLTFREIQPFITINLVGILMFLVRSVLYVLNGSGTLFQAFGTYYPVIFFYIFYSIFFVLLDVRSLVKTPYALFLSIWICDSIPNIIEVIVRQEWRSVNFEEIIFTIILIGLLRTFITTILVYVSRYYYEKSKERENHHIFVDRIMLMSNLKNELFFLRKSKNDIEDAMQRSFTIYEQAEDLELKESILSVTKDIHEIKKDYTRVISGLEKSIKDSPIYNMNIKEIFEIVMSSNKKYAISRRVSMKFSSNIGFDFKTEDYLALISILNNIVTNAVEAFKYEGKCAIEQRVEENQMIFEVSNDGDGIDPQDIPLIFEPGFSTKFNENNGVMASGIGLTHVKHLVEDYFEGSIEVVSKKSDQTCFKISIPMERMLTSRSKTKEE